MFAYGYEKLSFRIPLFHNLISLDLRYRPHVDMMNEPLLVNVFAAVNRDCVSGRQHKNFVAAIPTPMSHHRLLTAQQ
jgi:hypothetical protein